MKRFSPAAERNTPFVLELLAEHLGPEGRLLEIASGSGQHAVALAEKFEGWTIQPSEVDAVGRASIEAYRTEVGTANLAAPLDLDVTRHPWPVDEGAVDAIVLLDVLEDIEHPVTTLQHMKSALKDGGVAIIMGNRTMQWVK